ncbi:MAG: arylesterase [Vicinamibacteria bacterium]|nr:arylesterase [Vicinamibacteria bacterium]
MRLTCALGLGLSIAAASAACSDRQAVDPAVPAAVVAPAAPPVVSARPRIVCLGDSLTAGYGVSSDEAYPAQLAARLRAAGFDYEVANAGVSGDTSAGGLRRLDWSMVGDVQVLVVALGANDGLRGLPPKDLRANLARIIETAQARHVRVVLAGMEAPPNFGATYTRDFRAVYRDLAQTYDVTLVPFFLEGVAGVPSLNQADGIHPTAEGQRIVAATIWRAVAPLVGVRASS